MNAVKKRQAIPFETAAGAGLRNFLYLTAGVTGAVILMVEILGAKMLSPYLGTSHFVWTAQITVALLALAAGYYAGGRMADRSPDLGGMYACILAAGIYLYLTVLVVEPVTYSFMRFNLAAGALFSSALLFFIPLTLLAAVGPYCVRALTQSLAGVGGQVGRLSAISTVGSVLGTLSIGYVLLPFVATSTAMFLTASLLTGIVLAYFLVWGKNFRQRKGIAILGVAALAVGFGGFHQEKGGRFKNMEEVYRGNSNFGLLQVLRGSGGNQLYFLNDYLTQNTYDTERKQSLSMFTYMLHGLARVYTPEIRRALCIGLGVGIVPMQFAGEGVEVDAVEINPSIIPVAIRYFDLDPERMSITIGDGRHFVNRSARTYDTIILDAFLGDSSPSHLMSIEAFSSMKQALNPKGTLVINSFGYLEPGRDFFAASMHKTLSAVFESVKIYGIGNGNLFFVASDVPELERVRSLELEGMPQPIREQVRRALGSELKPQFERGLVLTDSYNPVEFFDSANRERFRRETALVMKNL